MTKQEVNDYKKLLNPNLLDNVEELTESHG